MVLLLVSCVGFWENDIIVLGFGFCELGDNGFRLFRNFMVFFDNRIFFLCKDLRFCGLIRIDFIFFCFFRRIIGMVLI